MVGGGLCRVGIFPTNWPQPFRVSCAPFPQFSQQYFTHWTQQMSPILLLLFCAFLLHFYVTGILAISNNPIGADISTSMAQNSVQRKPGFGSITKMRRKKRGVLALLAITAAIAGSAAIYKHFKAKKEKKKRVANESRIKDEEEEERGMKRKRMEGSKGRDEDGRGRAKKRQKHEQMMEFGPDYEEEEDGEDDSNVEEDEEEEFANKKRGRGPMVRPSGDRRIGRVQKAKPYSRRGGRQNIRNGQRRNGMAVVADSSYPEFTFGANGNGNGGEHLHNGGGGGGGYSSSMQQQRQGDEYLQMTNIAQNQQNRQVGGGMFNGLTPGMPSVSSGIFGGQTRSTGDRLQSTNFGNSSGLSPNGGQFSSFGQPHQNPLMTQQQRQNMARMGGGGGGGNTPNMGGGGGGGRLQRGGLPQFGYAHQQGNGGMNGSGRPTPQYGGGPSQFNFNSPLQQNMGATARMAAPNIGQQPNQNVANPSTGFTAATMNAAGMGPRRP